MNSKTAAAAQQTGSAKLANQGIALLERIPMWLVQLLARLGIAGIFWRSGQTKVAGWEFWDVTDSALYLFREEYKVPLLPPEIAAPMASTFEHVFPVLLVFGLASRLSALGLLGMTLVIQIFVYPSSWPDHAMWAAALLIIIARGPGLLSLDHLIAKKFK